MGVAVDNAGRAPATTSRMGHTSDDKGLRGADKGLNRKRFFTQSSLRMFAYIVDCTHVFVDVHNIRVTHASTYVLPCSITCPPVT
jgi:hypothetical protein